MGSAVEQHVTACTSPLVGEDRHAFLPTWPAHLPTWPAGTRGSAPGTGSSRCCRGSGPATTGSSLLTSAERVSPGGCQWLSPPVLGQLALAAAESVLPWFAHALSRHNPRPLHSALHLLLSYAAACYHLPSCAYFAFLSTGWYRTDTGVSLRSTLQPDWVARWAAVAASKWPRVECRPVAGAQ